VVRYWSILDISIFHLKKTELFTTVIPSKLFECMGMGIPVLHGVRGESADIVLQEKIGEVFEPENAQALVDGISKLKNNNDLYPSYLKPQHCWLHSFPQSHSDSMLMGFTRLPPPRDSNDFGYTYAI